MEENILEIIEESEVSDQEVDLEVSETEESSAIVTTQEFETLQEINEKLDRTNDLIEYGNCLLIVFIVVIILNYAYKFFKLFF